MNAIQKLRSAWAHRGGRDPVLEAFMNAPVVDEPLTPEEEESCQEAWEEYKRGESVPLEELNRTLP